MNDDEIVGKMIRRFLTSEEYTCWSTVIWHDGTRTFMMDDRLDITREEQEAITRMAGGKDH